ILYDSFFPNFPLFWASGPLRPLRRLTLGKPAAQHGHSASSETTEPGKNYLGQEGLLRSLLGRQAHISLHVLLLSKDTRLSQDLELIKGFFR
uniref:Uncharacterized protein n=1 Tax=Dromaius novaehollandiae TaxID=8790 RepID=A0A8C4K970_DRONO